MKMGTGRYVWANGDTFEGSFMNDAREGKGTYRWKDGEEISGLWRNNKLNGEVKYSADKKTYNFHMIDGTIAV